MRPKSQPKSLCVPCTCTCQTGMCKVHLCLRRRRSCCPCRCPKPVTVPIADCNGRLLCNACKCSFPWSDYLKEKWICPKGFVNCCGRKHLEPNIHHLPSFIPDDERDTAMLQCGDEGDASKWVTKFGKDAGKATAIEAQICRQFKSVRSEAPPVIWVYGHAHKPSERIRTLFCKELAKALDFVHIDFDEEISYWSGILYRQANDFELSVLPVQVKRLAAMCVELMGDEELHLNAAGITEMIRLIMVCWMTDRHPPKGFIFEGFPCNPNEASMFEREFYQAAVGIYFVSKCWAKRADPPDCYLEVNCPKYFRRDANYDEIEIERMVDGYGDKSIKVINIEDFAEAEAYYCIKKVKEKLGVVRVDESGMEQAVLSSPDESANDGRDVKSSPDESRIVNKSNIQQQPQQQHQLVEDHHNYRFPARPRRQSLCGNPNCTCCSGSKGKAAAGMMRNNTNYMGNNNMNTYNSNNNNNYNSSGRNNNYNTGIRNNNYSSGMGNSRGNNDDAIMAAGMGGFGFGDFGGAGGFGGFGSSGSPFTIVCPIDPSLRPMKKTGRGNEPKWDDGKLDKSAKTPDSDSSSSKKSSKTKSKVKRKKSTQTEDCDESEEKGTQTPTSSSSAGSKKKKQCKVKRGSKDSKGSKGSKERGRFDPIPGGDPGHFERNRKGSAQGGEGSEYEEEGQQNNEYDNDDYDPPAPPDEFLDE